MRWRAKELLAAEFPPARFAVPGLVAQGLNLLVGPPKVGKSGLVMALVVSVSSGGLALGRVPIERGGAIYFALEDPGVRLQRRLRMVLGTDPVPDGLVIENEWRHSRPSDLDTPWNEPEGGSLEWLDQALSEDPGIRVVVVDVLARIRPPDVDRRSAYRGDYEALLPLKEIADRHNVAVVVVHHTRKQAADDYIDTVSGTAGLAGAADAVLVLSRSRGASDGVLRVTGRDLEEADYPLRYDRGLWTMLEGPASDYETTEERRKILTALREHGSMAPKAIAEKSGVGYDVVRHLVRNMATHGQIGTDGSGSYTVHRVHSVHREDGLDSSSVNGVNDEKSAVNRVLTAFPGTTVIEERS